MYAIIRAGGHQLRVSPGETVWMNRFEAQPGDAYENDQVLLIGKDDGEVQVGQPLVAGAKVQGTVLEERKAKKIIIFKRKRRKGYRKKQGHRQRHTVVKIDAIQS